MVLATAAVVKQSLMPAHSDEGSRFEDLTGRRRTLLKEGNRGNDARWLRLRMRLWGFKAHELCALVLRKPGRGASAAQS